MQKELMYNINSIVVSLVLLAIILLANELGFRLGRRFQKNSDQEVKSQTNSIQAGILGLLALLLGFTFNMSLQRFDNRSMAQIDEANAIGTAMLRTKLLPAPYNTETHSLFQEYVDLRIKTSKIDLTKESERKQINKETDDLQSKIWEKALAAIDSPKTKA